LPADKGSFGNFNDLANKNKEVIRAILESTDTPNVVPDYDEQILAKLRGLYSSCTNEDHLNDLGAEPLLNFTRTLRNLLHGKTLTVDSEDAQSTKNISSTGLTAALSFLHSRGS
jgi:endothelin-converting enzyme